MICSPLPKTELLIKNTAWHSGAEKDEKPDKTVICRRFSYLHPELSKFIPHQSLGTLYKTDSFLKKIAKKEIVTEPTPKEKIQNYQSADPIDEQTSGNGAGQSMDSIEKTENRSREFHGIPSKHDNAFRRNAEKTGSSLPNHDTVSVLFFHSKLRLVTDLRYCIKAQQMQAYAQKVKLTNLKHMAETLAYIQKHSYNTREILKN